MGVNDMRTVAALIVRALRGEDAATVRDEVRELAVAHPIYGLPSSGE
jgi:hypothetical protein